MAENRITAEMDLSEVKTYIKRLTTVYNKKEAKMFIEQYLQGSGNELKEKFWSRKSSSRLAFDLYSWMVNEDCTKDFQFEKKLPGVICSNHGPAGSPNMDVFIETSNDIIYIESKYTEKAKRDKNKHIKYISEDPKQSELSKAYWFNGKHGGLELKQRFYNEKEIARLFSEFCYNDIYKLIKNIEYKWTWFDVKQETCHLFGIIFALLQAGKYGNEYRCEPKELSKNVHLYNIIWDENDKIKCELGEPNSFPNIFGNKAEMLVKKCVELKGVKGIEFNFEIMTVQSLMNENDFFGFDFTKANAFGLDKSLHEQMEQYKLSY